MASRLLARLDAQIARARDPVQRACLRAERAGFLGRHGQVGLARTQLQDLQRAFAQAPHAAVSGWLALAEGQVDYYEHLGGRSHDRFNRAHALSRAAGLTPLQALSAAWLAHAEDARHRRDRMATLCAEALSLAAADHHAARWRAALTVAGAYHFAGRLDRAQPWYTAARSHAMADGDDAAISALMWSQASLRVCQARLEAASAPDDPGAPPLAAVLGAESTDRFDAVMGLRSLDWLLPMLRAQLLVLQGQWGEALAVIDEHWSRSQADWQQRMQPLVQADRAWCLQQLGRDDEARDDARGAEQALQQGPCDLDDRVLAQAQLARLWSQWGDDEAAARWLAAARADHDGHREQQRELVSLLDETVGAMTP